MDSVSLPTWDIHNDHDIGSFSKNAVILETNRLMYGVHDGNGSKRDITIGPVDAVNYVGGWGLNGLVRRVCADRIFRERRKEEFAEP